MKRINLQLRDGNKYYSEPVGYLSSEGFEDFWAAMGVFEGDEEKVHPEWLKGNWIPVAPEFPVLSRLIQMELDNAEINPDQVSEAIREIAVGRQRCSSAVGIAVFDALDKAAKLALAQGVGVSLSPYG